MSESNATYHTVELSVERVIKGNGPGGERVSIHKATGFLVDKTSSKADRDSFVLTAIISGSIFVVAVGPSVGAVVRLVGFGYLGITLMNSRSRRNSTAVSRS